MKTGTKERSYQIILFLDLIKLSFFSNSKLNIIIKIRVSLYTYIIEKYVMTRIVLFDLGDTLEHNGVLREDALETLNRIKSMENPPILGLAPDFGLPHDPPPTPEEQIRISQQHYFSILSDLQIDQFFNPLQQNVTLSTEVGKTKSEDIKKFFQTAINKISNTNFNEIIFITENIDHIRSANSLGVKTIFLKLENNSSQTNGTYTISNLIESLNLIEGLLNSS